MVTCLKERLFDEITRVARRCGGYMIKKRCEL